MHDNKISIWKTLADELNGKYIERKDSHSDKADFRFEEFQIVFDNYTVYKTVGSITVNQTYTRVVCPYSSAEDFRFQIFRKSLLGSINKLFGAQDITINDEIFDREFIIKSNDKYRIPQLLNNRKLLDLIQAQEKLHLEVSDQKGIWEEKLAENDYELSFYTEGKIKSIDSLKSLLVMFTELVRYE